MCLSLSREYWKLETKYIYWKLICQVGNLKASHNPLIQKYLQCTCGNLQKKEEDVLTDYYSPALEGDFDP